MDEQASCACLTVKYVPIKNDDGSWAECWKCPSCEMRFVKYPKPAEATPVGMHVTLKKFEPSVTHNVLAEIAEATPIAKEHDDGTN